MADKKFKVIVPRVWLWGCLSLKSKVKATADLNSGKSKVGVPPGPFKGRRALLAKLNAEELDCLDALCDLVIYAGEVKFYNVRINDEFRLVVKQGPPSGVKGKRKASAMNKWRLPMLILPRDTPLYVVEG